MASTVFPAAGAINPTTIDAKGDLIGGTADNAFARLAVGANDTVLTADSTAATGLKWAAAGGANKSYSLLSTTSLTGTSVTVSGLSGYDNFQIIIDQAICGTTSNQFFFRFSGDTGSNYIWGGGFNFNGSTYDQANMGNSQTAGSNQLLFGRTGNASNGNLSGGIFVTGGNNTTGTKAIIVQSTSQGGGTLGGQMFSNAIWNNTAVISTITFKSAGATFTAGTMRIYGAA